MTPNVTSDREFPRSILATLNKDIPTVLLAILSMSLAFASLPSDATFSVVADSQTVADVSAHSKFGYDATEARGKRKTARQYSTSEDVILDAGKRTKLQSNGRDLARNFSIASWMIRRHLDYVATFDFHCRTGDTKLDETIERFVEKWSLKWNFDRAGRHNLPRMIRLAEARRVIDGDIGFLKLANGQLQGIESDRIKQPQGELASNQEWIHGVKTDGSGKALAYALWNRTKHGLRFDRTVPASRMEMLGYYDRFDQIRGISPLASALNPLRDVYENFDLKMVQTKVASMFGAIFTTDAIEGFGESTYTGDEADEPAAKNKYDVDFGKGPLKLELDPGDKLEFVESKNPSSEWQNFQALAIQVALKALDIPFSGFSEDFTNFYGSRAAWLHYQRSCKPKSEDIRELLNNITFWRLSLAILDGEIELPGSMRITDLDYEWILRGMPWWDPAKEIRGDLTAISAGLDNPQRIVKERGRGDFYDNVDRIAEAQAYAKEKGVPLSFITEPDEIVVQEVQE